jgi:Rod binding domain-containing protein
MMGPESIHHSPVSAASVASQSLQPLKTTPTPDGGESFHQALASETSKTDKIADVSKQFEALMIGQLLRSARESSGGGWLDSQDDQDDQTGSMVMDMAEQGFSQAMAARGGLGIAKMVTANLERGQAKTPSSDSGTATPAPANTDWKRLPPAHSPAP